MEVVSVLGPHRSFFFQAEDGIRYLVRSRGLGDVYKRQEMMRSYCDNVDAWVNLRWQPATPLTDGLRRTAEYLSLIHI